MYETAKLINTENLKNTYNLVSVENVETTFEESWTQILEKFKKMDLLRQKNR